MMEKVIEVSNLKREFEYKNKNRKKEKILAVNNVSFDVYKGETFGILGPNGAGKTTIIKILSTLLAPTNGIAKVFGYETFFSCKDIRSKINFIFGGELGLYGRLSAYENLVYFATLYDIDKGEIEKKVHSLLKLVGLEGLGRKKVETFSKGMKQKLQIARGLINDPEVLFLDEPTIGLDPVASMKLKMIIKELHQNQKTIILTTHYMAEADELCDRIAIMKNGCILKIDRPENLKRLCYKENIIQVKAKFISSKEINLIRQKSYLKIIDYKQFTEYVLLIISSVTDLTINDIVQDLKNVEIYEITKRKATLEDVYIKLINGDMI